MIKLLPNMLLQSDIETSNNGEKKKNSALPLWMVSPPTLGNIWRIAPPHLHLKKISRDYLSSVHIYLQLREHTVLIKAHISFADYNHYRIFSVVIRRIFSLEKKYKYSVLTVCFSDNKIVTN